MKWDLKMVPANNNCLEIVSQRKKDYIFSKEFIIID